MFWADEKMRNRDLGFRLESEFLLLTGCTASVNYITFCLGFQIFKMDMFMFMLIMITTIKYNIRNYFLPLLWLLTEMMNVKCLTSCLACSESWIWC